MKKKLVDKSIIILSLFIVGSLIGFIHENLFAMLKGQEGIRQGLIYGPFIPVYGVGLLLFYLMFSSFYFRGMSKFWKIILVFVVGFFMGGFTEYLCSFLQEVIMGTKSWDYSNVRFNLNGRTSLFHACCWGLMSVLFYLYVLPILQKTKKFFDNKKYQLFIMFMGVFMLFDCTISILACLRQEARRKNVKPNNKIDELLDKYYPDEYLNNIYYNAVVVDNSKKTSN